MDELVFLDIYATNENRGITYDLISRVAENINIPLLLAVELTPLIKLKNYKTWGG
ncbi:hypothetical protein [Acidiplasma cupricumulans]|uniref:hypothetical protein n=1 Tax=Acidiplasma cupricumulans TaxID=312540 RepID=UPI000A6EF0DA|nr:hypothetical protein [Acidiplasma cupricumulans]